MSKACILLHESLHYLDCGDHENDPVPCTSKTLVCPAAQVKPLIHALQNPTVRQLLAKDSTKPTSSSKIIFRIKVTGGIEETVNRAWETRICQLFLKFLGLEKMLWNLSTLGGAYSALGDFDQKFASRAIVISHTQLKLAAELGDPVLVGRCKLYLALAAAQFGKFKEAYAIVKHQMRNAKALHSDLLMSCGKGVWMKIKAVELLGTKVSPSQMPQNSNSQSPQGTTKA